MEDRSGFNATGRDHHPHGFTVWLAGAGIKGGTIHGATDELGFHAVEHRHYVTDLHATVLHLMGMDHERLTYRFAGRDFPLDFSSPINSLRRVREPADIFMNWTPIPDGLPFRCPVATEDGTCTTLPVTRNDILFT